MDLLQLIYKGIYTNSCEYMGNNAHLKQGIG